jgi:putative flippase GtrA
MREIINDIFRLPKITVRRRVVDRFLAYSAVGIVGGTAHYLVLIVLHQFFHVSPVIASAMGFIVGAFVNYLLNFHVTFESDAAHKSVMPKFYLIATAGFLLNIFIMWQLVHHFEMHYIGSQLVATGVVLAWGFVGNSIWTFKKAQ